MKEVFCTYCGAKFSARPQSAQEQAQETLAYVRSAYQAGEYAEAARAAQELTEVPALRAFAAAAGLRGAYAAYRRSAQELYEKQRAKSGLVKLVTGRDSYSTDSLHTDFFKEVSEQCAALGSQGDELGGQAVYAALCGDAVELLLRYKTPQTDPATYWSECALEHEAAALLVYLPDEQLAAVYAAYIGCHKPHELLPNQVKLEKAMRGELEKRGLDPARRPGFGARLRAKFGAQGAGRP